MMYRMRGSVHKKEKARKRRGTKGIYKQRTKFLSCLLFTEKRPVIRSS